MKKAEYDFRGLPLAEKDESQYKQNPAAKQAYRVKIEIQGALGPLKLQHFKMFYQADNCSYMVNRLAGVTSFPHTSLDVDYQQTGENRYEGVVYLDGMLDEDYYGQGVCHWYSIGSTISFKATGSEQETRFDIDADKDEFLAQKTIKRYYYKADYPITRIQKNGVEKILEGSFDSGIEESKLSPKIPRDQWFTITMSIEEVK